MDVDRDEEGFLGYDIVRSLGDVEDLRVDFDASQFSQLFFENHEESLVVVHSLCNICYIGTSSQLRSRFCFFLLLLGTLQLTGTSRLPRRGCELVPFSVRHYMGNFPRPDQAGSIQTIDL
jgi:hypothetical protein